ncbi:MAG: hypothetical protein NZM44_05145 [Candidatus Calescibacterium sp.]|nr:hypothetical protein [Candidatus Calescibacterium sp.]
MKKESVFRQKIEKVLKSKGHFVYHIKDVPHTGTRALDIICCIEGRFVGIETKVIKSNSISEQKVLKTLRASQENAIKEIIKNKGIVYIYVFWYSKYDISITHTTGRVKVYRCRIDDDGNIYLEERPNKLLPSTINL